MFAFYIISIMFMSLIVKYKEKLDSNNCTQSPSVSGVCLYIMHLLLFLISDSFYIFVLIMILFRIFTYDG